MTTAIDSNVLIDLIGDTSSFTEASIEAMDSARMKGALIVCPVVVAEISGHFLSPGEMHETLAEMQISIKEFRPEALHAAGRAFVRYRQRSSNPKDRMLADFLIGANAQVSADRLLTRDRGYYRTYFPKLQVISVGTHE